MRRVSRQLLAVIAVVLVASAIWSKLRIGIFIHVSLFQAFLLFAFAALVIFLGLDHFLNGRR